MNNRMKTECKDCGGELNIQTDVVVGESFPVLTVGPNLK